MAIRRWNFLIVAVVAGSLLASDFAFAQMGGNKGGNKGGNSGNKGGKGGNNGGKGGSGGSGGNKGTGGKSAEEKRQEKKEKEAYEKSKEGVKAPTNLDETQQAALEFLDEKAYPKLYDLTTPIPDAARKEVLEKFFTTVYGTHKPDRAQADKVAEMIIEELNGGRIANSQATVLTDSTAEVLSGKVLSKGTLDGYKVELGKLLLRTRITDVRQGELTTELEKLIREAKADEAKLKAKDAAEEAKKAAARKKADDEAEKERKRQERLSGKQGSGGSGKGGSGGNRGSGGNKGGKG